MTPADPAYTPLAGQPIIIIAISPNADYARADKMRGHSVAPIHDLAAQLPGGAEMFYDDFHFSAAGAAAVADIVHRGIGRLN